MGTASITSFYSQQKKPTSVTALPTKGIPDVSEQPRGVKPPRGLAAAMDGGAAPLGPRVRAGDPGGILGVGSPAPQPKQGTLRSMFASQSGDDNRQSACKPGNTVLSQPGLDCSVQARPTAQLPAGTNSADAQTSDRDMEDDLMLHSPYAMRLRQKQGGQAAQLRQMCTPSSSAVCFEDRDIDHAVGSGREIDHYSTVDLAGNGPRSQQQHQDQQVAKQYGHRPLEGQLNTSSRAGRLPSSPDAVTPRGQLLLSPKRGLKSCEEQGLSTTLSVSGSEGDLEISLLSPSPAKRYANITPSVPVMGRNLSICLFGGYPSLCCLCLPKSTCA